MNKTLLLIICDFLLLNLLALTRWEKMEPIESRTAPVPAISANTTRGQDDDLLAALRLALEQEQVNRETLAEKLRTETQARTNTATQFEREKRQLESSIQESRVKALELEKKLDASSRQATQTREKLGQVQTALAAKQAEAERQQQTLTETMRATENERRRLIETLSQQQAEVQRQRRSLTNLEQAKTAAETKR